MLLHGSAITYEVGNLLAATAAYRVYLARDVSTSRYCLLQVAKSLGFNGGLDRAAFLLQRFKSNADAYDVEFSKTHARKHLHYDRLYPAILESFVSDEQGGRRINVLTLTDVDDVQRIVPLSNLRLKDALRIDPETSAWVLGRLLKLLTFVHGEGVQNRAITARNVLLDPDQHFAITLDWSTARMFPGQIPKEFAAQDIAGAASAVFAAIGGDVDRNVWPYEGHHRYVALLMQFMRGEVTSADDAHDQFYKLVRAEYGQEFHPFTTLSL